MTFEIHDLDPGVRSRLSELARKHGRTMETEAAEILTAATRGEVRDGSAVIDLYSSARRVVSKEALAPPTQVDFTPDGF
ncbi:FitA-like ribbon-helix-helix domain-containing protein [Janibacter alittae]|uniref:Antitoxin FitA-like ribbon-helix-helix domain-containing protein n=1 Tax=Janibacter alittae TaxID=3115209 RepID=A0ABZ2MD25_9MICO